MAQAKKKVVVTIETPHYDTLKALAFATKVAENVKEQRTGTQPIVVLSVQVR